MSSESETLVASKNKWQGPATSRWVDVTREDSRQYRLRFVIPGMEKTRVIRGWQWRSLQKLAKKWGLHFTFEKRDEWLTIKPDGIPLNVAAIVQWRGDKMQMDSLRAQAQELEQRMGEVRERLGARHPSFQVLEPAFVERFVTTLDQWDEVLESGMAGKELDYIAPRFTVPQDAQMAVRLQPVRLRKWISGKEFWAITPPMPFTLHPDHVLAQNVGHPHVYPDIGKLCVGDAKFDYGNPFNVMGVLREWYVGYNPKDVADKDWLQHSRMWWQANGALFLEKGALVIEAPDRERERSALNVLSAEDVKRFCSVKGWVAEKAQAEEVEEEQGPPMRAYERWGGAEWVWLAINRVYPYDAHFCEVDGHAMAVVEAVVSRDGDPNTIIYLCGCHLAELNMYEPDVRASTLRAEAELLVGQHARMCQAGSFFTNATAALPATRTSHGHYLCEGHALLFRGGRGGAAGNPTRDMDKAVLAGELGAGHVLSNELLQQRFPNRAALWRSACRECGEALEAHWGLTCPRDAKFRLAADHPANHAQVELWSKWDWADAKANEDVGIEVAKFKAHFAKHPKDATHGGELKSFANIVRRLKANDGTELDGVGGDREHWVVDTLRKFGREVTAETRCVDCAQPWSAHTGPNCA